MAGSVIERRGTTIGDDGVIVHDDVQSTFEAAEKIAGSRLDRRRAYAIIDGQVLESATWSQACSGCYEGYNSATARGFGCDECGYTGRRRNGAWVPLSSKEAKPCP